MLLHRKIPTFPPDKCKRFINLLTGNKGSMRLSHTLRHLWPGYGSSSPITAFSRTSEKVTAACSPCILSRSLHLKSVLRGISKLLFNLPIEHREHLENLWLEELVISAAWRKHVSGRVGDLSQKMTWIFALSIFNILILPISYRPALNKSSIVLCILGLCIALVLYQEQRRLVDTGGTVGGFWMAFGDLPQRILLPTVIAVVLGLVGTAVWVALNPRETLPGPMDSEASLPASVP